MAGFKFDVKKRKQGDLKEIKYESISISKTFNYGNYESTKIAILLKVQQIKIAKIISYCYHIINSKIYRGRGAYPSVLVWSTCYNDKPLP